MQQIKSFGVLQTSKVIAALYFVLGLCFAVVVMIVSAVAHRGPRHAGILFLIGAPIFYGAVGFVMGAIISWLYNVIAGRIGGIEIDLGSPEA
jgi:hypothetical protein